MMADTSRLVAGAIRSAMKAAARGSACVRCAKRNMRLAWCEKAGQHAYAGLAPLVFDTEAADTRAAQLLNDAARALGGIALALDPDGRLPLVVSGSIGGRLQLRLTPSIRARLVEPAGDAVDGALHLIRARLEQTGRRFDDR